MFDNCKLPHKIVVYALKPDELFGEIITIISPDITGKHFNTHELVEEPIYDNE